MKKIISETKKERTVRNKAIIADFEDAMEQGSDKTAVYKYLAKKHHLSHQRVCAIVNDYYKEKKNNPKIEKK